MSLPEHFETFTLSNGLRLIHRRTDSPVAHAGVVIEAGCRDEFRDEHGMAHFLEHCLFKGTEKRKSSAIIRRLEEVGGDLNAYTAREETMIYGSFLPEYYGRSLELFADVLFRSTFPEKEIEKEKLVVLEEINAYKDNPYDTIYEQFEEMVFRKHPIGRNILGTAASIKAFTPEKIRAFTARLYRPSRMVLCSVGDIGGKDLLALAEKYFGEYNGEGEKSPVKDRPFDNGTYQPFHKELRKRTFQTHTVMGGLAYHYNDPRRLAFALLVNMLGGPAMSSRLNMLIRERYGNAYTVEASYYPFRETGIFTVYLGTDPQKLQRSVQMVEQELSRCITKKPGTLQLHHAKRQYKGQMAISLEVNLNQLMSIGKSYLVYGRVDTFAEMSRKIDAITASDLMAVAAECFGPGKLSRLTYKSRA